MVTILERVPIGVAHRTDAVRGFEGDRTFEDRFRRAFRDEQAVGGVRRLNGNRETPALEVEGQLVELLVSRDVELAVPENRGVQWASDAGFQAAVDVGQREHAVRWRPARVERPLK